MSNQPLPCGCHLAFHLLIPSDDAMESLSGRTLRGYANAHMLTPTGQSGDGFSRWRNQASPSELRRALMNHRNCTFTAEAMQQSLDMHNSTIPGADKIPSLLDAVELLLKTVGPDVIQEHILEAVTSEVSRYRTTLQQVEVVVPNQSSVVMNSQHKDFPKLVRLMGANVNVMLVGPAGSGKTEAAMAAAKSLQLPFEIISVGPQTMQSELAGFRNANGQYIESAVRRAYEQGKVLIVDEIDAGNPGVFTFMNGTLANSNAGYPDGLANRHPNFRVIACANTFGSGADMVYVGRNQLDGATLDRYATIVWDYDVEFERHLALSFNPKADEWVNMVQSWRNNMLRHKLRHIISPRASIMGAKLLAVGFTIEECAAMLVFKGMNKEAMDKIQGRVDGVA